MDMSFNRDLTSSWEGFVLAAVGSFVLQAVLITKGKPTIDFIRPFWPRLEKNHATWLNALIFTFVGAFLALVMTNPDTPRQALTAGLGWMGLITAGISQK